MSVSAGMVRVTSAVRLPALAQIPVGCLAFCCGRIRSVVCSLLSRRQFALLTLCLCMITVYSILLSHSPQRSLQFVARRTPVDINVLFNTSFFRTYSNTDDVPNVEVSEVSCQKLYANDEEEVEVAGKYHEVFQTNQRSLGPRQLKTLAKDCDSYKSSRGYMLKPANQEEEEFPLAFSILMYADPGQAERLLRAIYRPQNYYCIHVDKKSEPDVHGAMRAVAGCFDNVFIASRKVTVSWGDISVVQAEITCMQDLMQYKAWKYFINLTGQEFPIRTNAEIVKILKQYRGANDIPGVPANKMQDAYIDRVERPRVDNLPRDQRPQKKPFKHLVDIHFGTAHITASRDFIGFLLNKTVSRDLLEWLGDTRIPDETYFSTLAHDTSLEMPGGYTVRDGRGNETVNRFKVWRPMQPCSKYKHRVCILGLVNLPQIVSSKSLFANKFSHDFQPLAFDCLEERIFANTRLDIRGWKEFDSAFYHNQPFAVNARRLEEAGAEAAAVAQQPVKTGPKQAKAKDRAGLNMGKDKDKRTGQDGNHADTKKQGSKQEPNKQVLRESPALAKYRGKGKAKTKKGKGKH